MTSAADDRQAITDQIHIYCRAVDRIDAALGHSIWHEGSFADYGAEYYQGPGPGAIDKICENHRSLIAHAHQVTNILIRLDGDKAGSETYCLANLQMQRGDALMQMTVWTRYIDSWERRGGRWGLVRRAALRDFDEVREVRALSTQRDGRRDRDDPSYAVLG